MSDLKRMTCIHHLSLYTMLDGYVLASLVLIASFVFSFIALQLYSLLLFLGLHVPRLLSYNPPPPGECGVMGMVILWHVRAKYNLVPRLHCYYEDIERRALWVGIQCKLPVTPLKPLSCILLHLYPVFSQSIVQ